PGPMAAPFGPPPRLAITWIFPSGVTRDSVCRAISTRITDPSGIAIGPSGNLSPAATCVIAAVSMAMRSFLSACGERLLVYDHAALDLALLHQVERVVELRQRQPPRDHLVELVPAVHEQVNQHRHVRPLVAAAERRTGEHALLEQHRRIDGD